MTKLLEKEGLNLGFGLMRLPRLLDGSIDIEQGKKMVDSFIEAGGIYFDTAYVYEGSEQAAKKMLVERYPRDSYYLASKLNAMNMCSGKEEARKQIDISLERTGAEYFDFYLLHALGRKNIEKYDEYGLWDYVKDLKSQGKIKHYGFSFHDKADFLDELLTKHPDVEFIQLQINYADWEDHNVQSRACYEVARKHNKPIVIMEPVKGGSLFNPPQSVQEVFRAQDPKPSMASWAIRYAASLEGVMMVLSGMSSIEQMEDNLSFMKDFVPLSEKERSLYEKAREVLSGIEKIDCTDCQYCVPGCPQKINIPAVFRCMNKYKIYNDLEAAKRDYGWVPGPIKASACIACGKCEKTCPQSLPIIELLKETAGALE